MQCLHDSKILNGKKYIGVTPCDGVTRLGDTVTGGGAIIHSQNTCDISTLETNHLNFIAGQLYIRKSGRSVLRVNICRRGNENGISQPY